MAITHSQKHKVQKRASLKPRSAIPEEPVKKSLIDEKAKLRKLLEKKKKREARKSDVQTVEPQDNELEEVVEEEVEEEDGGSDVDDDDMSQDQESEPHGDSEEEEEQPTAAPIAAADPVEEEENVTFAGLGVIPELVTACNALSFKKPTPIQAKSIPPALTGKDIIGLAQTGSGKTAAFLLPILQSLFTSDNPRPFYALVLAPTRELAYQIDQTLKALGAGIGVRSSVLVGGMDMMQQSVSLGKRPHVIVATPGRLMDHLENTKGFSLRNLEYLVMDEADRLLDLDFGPILDKILKVIPHEHRRTYLFSATMTTKVAKLQRASLKDPVRVEVSSKYTTVETLLQYYLLLPLKQKDAHLVYLTNELSSSSTIIFTRTVADAQRLSIILRLLGFPAIPLHGQLSQSSRLGALNKFKSGGRKILVATDVAARGLDIPLVDLVINYDIPTHSKEYIHRVGRTARAGRAGKAITLVSQYDVELLQRIEHVIGKKMDGYSADKEAVAVIAERVSQAAREAAMEMREQAKSGHGGKRGRDFGGKDDADRDDDVREAGMAYAKQSRRGGGGGGGRGGGGRGRGRGGGGRR